MAGLLDPVFAGLGALCNMLPYCNLLVIGFKIVMLLFIVGWVRSRLGGGLVATVVMLFIGYLALFQYFYIFGPMVIIYLLIIVGVTGMIQDFAFGGGMYGLGAEAKEAEMAQQGGLVARMMRGKQ